MPDTCSSWLMRRSTFLWRIASHSCSRNLLKCYLDEASSRAHPTDVQLMIHLGSWLAKPSVWCYDVGNNLSQLWHGVAWRCHPVRRQRFPYSPSFGAWPLIHISPYHSGILCLIQLKWNQILPNWFFISFDIHLVDRPKTYTEIYLHIYNVPNFFGRVYNVWKLI